MIRRRTPHKDVQKKVYHTDRFYEPLLTEKIPLEDSAYKDVFEYLNTRVKLTESYVELGQAVFYVKKEDVRETLILLKSYGYNVLSEMSAIDNLAIDGTFHIFYQLNSHNKSFANCRRMRVKCVIRELESMPSVSDILLAANWSERECYDMFGIKFENHPFLKRILMPTDWVGFPLLKSYPLKGDEFAAWYEVDRIFGREYRDTIGCEQRDSARVDRGDSINFARIGREVAKGEIPSDSIHKITYQEESKPPILQKFPDKPKEMENRI